ncbi:ABC transporter transmembrane region domain-containing protein [Cyclospora cayetanensis]|uniref:ABC transporter transmembrane region domain-containing protein n=1 Tax=Cyclospora cayetanensis TaxID=88456 RepID=A0A1D3D5F5_9EIME|nr:ABC transporter transmembrane region domain-containing protein [Cyclospora cayetanensis]
MEHPSRSKGSPVGAPGDADSGASIWPDEPSKAEKGPSLEASYDASGWWNRLFFCWVNPVHMRCIGGSVAPKELPRLWAGDIGEIKREALDKAIQKEELTKIRPSILRATLSVFWAPICIAFAWTAVREVLNFANTLLLKEFLRNDSAQWQDSWHQGLIAAGALAAVQLLLVFMNSHLDFFICRISIRVEAALLTSLYKRILNAEALGFAAVTIKSLAARRKAPECSGDDIGTSQTARQAAGPGGPREVTSRKGAIFSIVFVDIPSIAEMVVTFVDFALLPVRIALTATILVIQVGSSCIPAILALLGIVFCAVASEAFSSSLKLHFLKKRDTRLQRCHECLTEMRSLRLLGWEDIAEDIVNKQRVEELRWCSIRMYLSGFSYWLTSIAGPVTSVATFAAYAIPFIQGRAGALTISPALVVPVIHAMDNCIGPLADLPYTISSLIEGQISLNRIRSYLFRPEYLAARSSPEKTAESAETKSRQQQKLEEEPLLTAQKAEDSIQTEPKSGVSLVTSQELMDMAQKMLQAIHDPTLKVRFLDASFSWLPVLSTPGVSAAPERPRKGLYPVLLSYEHDEQSMHTTFSLDKITLDLHCGEVLLVTGPPGSGKTTLVSAILHREGLRLSGGACYVRDSFVLDKKQRELMDAGSTKFDVYECTLDRPPVGYVPQEAWLCCGTVRENIVFGEAFNSETYNAVVNACELTKDFESWRHGDLRVIDEGGLDLSGGQRVRVNIARAVYSCKLYQMKVAALGSEAKAHLHSKQEDLSECLWSEVSRQLDGSEGYEEFKRVAGSSPPYPETPSLGCLSCFDECFNSLDLSVAGHVFHNLFGPHGLLADCAVLVCLNDSSLMGLMRQHAGQHSFDELHRQYHTAKPDTEIGSEAGTDGLMQFSVCRLIQGEITWRGGIDELRELVGGKELPMKEDARTHMETIENLMAGHEFSRKEDESTRETHQDEVSPVKVNQEAYGSPRSLAITEQLSSGQLFWLECTCWSSDILEALRVKCKGLPSYRFRHYVPVLASFLADAKSFPLFESKRALRRFLFNITNMERDMCSVERIQSYMKETELKRLDWIGSTVHSMAGGLEAARWNREVCLPSAVLPRRHSGLQLLNVEVRYRTFNREDIGTSDAQPAASIAIPLSLPSSLDILEQTLLQSKPEVQLRSEGVSVPDLEASSADVQQEHSVEGRHAYFLKPSIRNFSAQIKAGERIGVVGRTGAGKSTLLQALCGLIPCYKGAIFLDGIRLDCLPRQVIRSVFGTLPQKSIVFAGWTVREVLDPRRLHSDASIWEALRAVGLVSLIQALPGGAGLDTVLQGGGCSIPRVSNGGQLASEGGQLAAAEEGSPQALSARQLRYLALGRLILEGPKLRVVLIDEPPAEELWPVGDSKEKDENSHGAGGEATRREGQKDGQGGSTRGWGRPTAEILSEHLKDCCVVVVAHHLASLRGCDRVWVMSDGCKVGECLPSDIDTEQKFSSYVTAWAKDKAGKKGESMQ